MTNEQFRAWKDRLNLTFQRAANDLGLAIRTVKGYADATPIPLVVELACYELERRFNTLVVESRPIGASDFSINLEARTIQHTRTNAMFAIGENDQILPLSAGTLEPHFLPRFAAIAAEALHEERKRPIYMKGGFQMRVPW